MHYYASSREKYDLQHTVDVMVDLGLTYSQTKNVDGTYHYQIDPDIHFLCNFKCKIFQFQINLFNSYLELNFIFHRHQHSKRAHQRIDLFKHADNSS